MNSLFVAFFSFTLISKHFSLSFFRIEVDFGAGFGLFYGEKKTTMREMLQILHQEISMSKRENTWNSCQVCEAKKIKATNLKLFLDNIYVFHITLL